jgi:hypothetical protein
LNQKDILSNYDAALEARIDELTQLIPYIKSIRAKQKIWNRLSRLHSMRRPEYVAMMERDRGLA